MAEQELEAILANRMVDALEAQAGALNALAKQVRKINTNIEMLGVAMYEIFLEEDDDDPDPGDEKPETAKVTELKAVGSRSS